MWIQPPEVILILLFKSGTADGNLHTWVHMQRKNTLRMILKYQRLTIRNLAFTALNSNSNNSITKKSKTKQKKTRNLRSTTTQHISKDSLHTARNADQPTTKLLMLSNSASATKQNRNQTDLHLGEILTRTHQQFIDVKCGLTVVLHTVSHFTVQLGLSQSITSKKLFSCLLKWI